MLSVLHVTEATGAGVMSAIDSYRRSTPDHVHHVLTVRLREHQADAPPSDWALSVGALRSVAPGGIATVARRLDCDVIHAHSTVAGAFSRCAWPAPPVIYTPHCFAFQRTTMRASARRLARELERAAARRTAAFAACSAAEARMCHELGQGAIPVVHIPHAVEPGPAREHTPDLRTAVVAMAGRICAQKDPDFFLAVIDVVRRTQPVEAVWVGDGDPDGRRRLEDAGVRVTGWVPSAAHGLRDAHIYLHSAAWEGEALTPLEAAAGGLPVVMRALPTMPDCPYATSASTVEGCAAAVVALYDGTARRLAAARGARAVRTHYSAAAQRQALVAAYEGAVGGRS